MEHINLKKNLIFVNDDIRMRFFYILTIVENLIFQLLLWIVFILAQFAQNNTYDVSREALDYWSYFVCIHIARTQLTNMIMFLII